jgi:glyoxylase-like metal-dependent hydrolase (beta-lactamase superfamily II)
MKNYKMILTLFVLLVATISSPVMSATEYRIEKVKGDIYRFVDDRHRSVFLVTDEGILLTDPLNELAALWLKAELKKLFDLPVRYVVYSHNHSDHIYGAKVFESPQTTFIAHQLARQDIQVTKSNTVIPDLTFDKDMEIFLGGHTIKLQYYGPNDGRGSISMLFEPEKVLFVVDWALVGRMPWKNSGAMTFKG